MGKKKEKKKELTVYPGRYFVAGKSKEKAEAIAERVSDSESQVLLLHPKKKAVNPNTVKRIVLRDRRPLRITPKRPKIT